MLSEDIKWLRFARDVVVMYPETWLRAPWLKVLSSAQYVGGVEENVTTGLSPVSYAGYLAFSKDKKNFKEYLLSFYNISFRLLEPSLQLKSDVAFQTGLKTVRGASLVCIST
jgi:hypothetical protein